MTPQTISGRIISWFFVLLPLCVGLFFIGKGLVMHPAPWESADWATTEGTITGWTVTLRGMHTMGRETSGKRSHFDADISYQYEIGGKVYAGEDARVVLDDYSRERLDHAEAEARARERFPVGATVNVFYDPNDHARSTLQPGWSSGAMGDFFVAAAGFALAGYIGWSFRTKAT